MTYDQLEMLEMIVEKGSFKAASEGLHKSQPSLSVAIKKLEEEFGILLFNREEYRPKLTEEGRIFYNQAKKTLASFRTLSAKAQELSMGTAESELTVVVDPIAEYDAIEGIFEVCLGQANPTELNFRADILDCGMSAVLAGEADFAVAPKTKDHEKIESHFFKRVEMIPVIASRAVETKDFLSDEDFFRTKPQIFVLQDVSTIEQRRETLPSLPNGQKSFVNSHSMKGKLIREGFGWGRMADHEVAEDLKRGQLLKIKSSVAQPISLDLHIMRHREKPMGPVGRSVWERLKQNVNQKKSKKSQE